MNFSCFNSKALEEMTAENTRLAEILKVKDDTERKQAGTNCRFFSCVVECSQAFEREG